MTPDRITLAYNAEQGLFNALNDWAHKFFSPETYECTLCRYTHGLHGMLMPWKKFIESLKFPALFLHQSEFRNRYPGLDIPLPAILVEFGGKLKVLLSAEDIGAAGNLDGLMRAVRSRLDAEERRPGG